MEITLEKIELVKDKTGVTYKEAKLALEKAEGDPLEAIILLEEEVNAETKEGFSKMVLEKVKELIKKGNVSKISIKRDGEVIANLPINAGIVGAVIAPWGVAAAAVAAFGFRCSIEIVTDNGELIDVTSKIMDTASSVKEKGGVAFDYAKEKAPEVWDFAKEKGTDAWEFAKEKGTDAWEFAKEKGTDAWEFAKEKAPEVWDKAKEKMEERKQQANEDLFTEIDIDDEEMASLLNDEDK